MNRQRWLRGAMWAVAAAIGLIVLGAAVRLWLIDGWLRTVRIDGASMAPSLCGQHLFVTCTDCGIVFRCDAEHLPAGGKLVCPNCGFRELQAGDFPARAGDAVLLDRWPVIRRSIHRGDIVALSDPLGGGLAVKRVAGLPGEKFAIRGGDLYADGQIVRKSLAEFWQVAVLVHDNDHLPHSATGGTTAFLRWKPQRQESRWQPAGGGFRYDPAAAAATGEEDWLQYVHWRCDASLSQREEPAPILDNDPYNQDQPRRLNEVTDLVLSCDVEFSQRGRLMLAVQRGDKWLEVEVDAAAGSISATADGQPVATAPAKRGLSRRRVRIDFGHFDAQLLLAIDNDIVLVEPIEASIDRPASIADAGSLLRISAAEGVLEVSHLRVWRDLFLLEPTGTERSWEMEGPLAAGEFLLLGDNPPVSIDGRHWKMTGIPRSTFRGVVMTPRDPRTQ